MFIEDILSGTNRTGRVLIDDTIKEAIEKLHEGDNNARDAIRTVLILVHKTMDVSIQQFLLDFDSIGIYGEDIHYLYKSVCESNPRNLILAVYAEKKGLLKYELADVVRMHKGVINTGRYFLEFNILEEILFDNGDGIGIYDKQTGGCK